MVNKTSSYAKQMSCADIFLDFLSNISPMYKFLLFRLIKPVNTKIYKYKFLIRNTHDFSLNRKCGK